MSLDPTKIKVISVVEEMPASVSAMPADYAKVTFEIEKHGPEFPVYVYRRDVSDENIIRVARHYLHGTAKLIAEATASWGLSDEEYQQIAAPPQKTVQKKGPAIPM
jgi:hypothetical protein